MNWLRKSLSRISLLALLFLAMGAVAPTISNVLASQSPADAVANFGKGPLQICSADGIKQILGAGTGGDNRQGHQASKGHCPFCHLQSPVILSSAAHGGLITDARHSLPLEIRQIHPHLSDASLLPPSRAPPVLTPVA